MTKRDPLAGSRSYVDLLTGQEPEIAPAPPEPEPEPPTLATLSCNVTPAEREQILSWADEREVPYSYLMRWLLVQAMAAVERGELSIPEHLGPAYKSDKRRKSRKGGP